MNILITNNPLIFAEYKDKIHVEYIETDLIGILTKARDKVHKGHCLLTHPLTGSVKPNETPYKSILLSESSGETDVKSVSIIEESIQAIQKFAKREIPKEYLIDLQTVDLSLIKTALRT